MLGKRHSEESKEKMRLAHLGKKMSEGMRKKMRQLNLGKRLSEEHKRKIRLASLGRKHSPETCEKIRQLKIARGLPKELIASRIGPRKINITYGSLHDYLRSHIPKPETCSKCNEIKKLDLANMTGVYNREFQNWQYLCRKCHNNFDWARKKHKHENTV